MRQISVILFFIITISRLDAQVTQQWGARYNGTGNSFDLASAMATDNSGNVYVTGESRNDTAQGSEDYVTIKYNSSGVQQWAASYNGPGNGFDEATAIAIDRFGNVYVTGWSLGAGTNSDYATIKYNSSGVQQWAARYNGTANLDDDAQAIVLDTSGNVYITGFSYGTGTNYDYVTIKYDNGGAPQWVARYNGPGNLDDFANSLAVDISGNVYVTGYTRGTTTGYDYATVKYNPAGVQQWASIYNGTANGDDYANVLVIDQNGNVYVTGYSPGTGTGNDYLTVKYNNSGVQQWASRYNGPGNGEDIANALAVDQNGNVFITGYSYGGGSSAADYATIKYNSAGTQQWAARYNGTKSSNDYGTALVIDNSGNVYVTGTSFGNGTINDYTTLKYNSAGTQQWVARYDGTAGSNDEAYAIALDSLGNVYVTGTSIGVTSGNDYATIKYSQVTGIEVTNGNLPKKYLLEQNFPNPFNPNTIIKFDIPEGSNGNVTLVIFDPLGKEITTPVNGRLNSGSYEIKWDGSNYPSGVYFYKIVVDGNSFNRGFIQTKKMLLIK